MAVHEVAETEKVFESVRDLEETVLGASREWVKTIGQAMPVEMPVVRTAVKSTFDFAETMVRAQFEFAHNVLRAVEHVTTPTSTPKKVARRPATPTRATKKAA